MIRPKITREQALVLLPEGPTHAVFFVAIRGYYLNSMGKPGKNDRGIYDDCICLVGPEYFKAFNGNTDPSVDREGIFTLAPGKHLFKLGNHKISGPHPYPAFRPATPDESLPGYRDGKEGIQRGIAINIHKGAFHSTSSEGCQTIYPDQWTEFQSNAYSLMHIEEQKEIPYYLIVQQ